jgi:hypothetical protein
VIPRRLVTNILPDPFAHSLAKMVMWVDLEILQASGHMHQECQERDQRGLGSKTAYSNGTEFVKRDTLGPINMGSVQIMLFFAACLDTRKIKL